MTHPSSHHSMDTHMNFRMSSDDKKIIETAARLKGIKPQTYARQKLIEIASREIEEMNQLNRLILSDEQWDQFIKIMEAPIKINENLKKAIRDFNEIEKD